MVIRAVEKIKSIGKKNREWMVGNAVILEESEKASLRRGFMSRDLRRWGNSQADIWGGTLIGIEKSKSKEPLGRSLPGWVLSAVRRPVWSEVTCWEVTAPAQNSQNIHCQDGCLACILSYYFSDICCFNFPTSLWLFISWLIHWEQSPEHFF